MDKLYSQRINLVRLAANLPQGPNQQEIRKNEEKKLQDANEAFYSAMSSESSHSLRLRQKT